MLTFTTSLDTTDNHNLLLRRLKGEEGISRPYRFRLTFLSANKAIDPATMLYRSMVIRAERDSDSTLVRTFSGIISRFASAGIRTHAGIEKRVYRATMVSPLAFLASTFDCRIFEQKTVSQLVEAVINGGSPPEFPTEFSLDDRVTADAAKHPSREYCVQYRESDLAFIARLMKEEGIFYFFEHARTDNSGTDLVNYRMVLGDGVVNYGPTDDDYGPPDAGATPEIHIPAEFQQSPEGQVVTGWTRRSRSQVDQWQIGDFDYLDRTPKYQSETGSGANSNRIRSVYDYGGRYRLNNGAEYDKETDMSGSDFGASLARVRLEAIEATEDVVTGSSTYEFLNAGHKFKVNATSAQCVGEEFVATRVEHFWSASKGYRNDFRSIPAAKPFRLPGRKRKPVVEGPQTAIVVNDEGLWRDEDDATVVTDELGRVRVQFHWNFRGDEEVSDASCWARVSQAWASSGWGSVLIPHVGDEVIVSFLEGDPDRPIVTGRVYNGSRMPPEDLPDNDHRAVVAWDHVGNFIVLDADDERVDMQNANDKFELTVGKTVEAKAGLDVGISLGINTSIMVGASFSFSCAYGFDLTIGLKNNISIGGFYDISLGTTYAWGKGTFVNAGDTTGQIIFKDDAGFTSQSSVYLTGGSGANNSIVNASSDGLVLSYGPTLPAVQADPGTFVKLVLGQSITGAAAGALAGACAFLGASAADESDCDGYMTGAVATGIGSGVAATLTVAQMIAMLAEFKDIQQDNHAAPSSVLRVNANGIQAITALDPGQQVELLSDKIAALGNKQHIGAVEEIKLQSDGTIKLQATTQTEVVGQFRTANILDMGAGAPAVFRGHFANRAGQRVG